jgi:ribosomal protein S18 acetylase RimI-like enzyme
VDYAAKWVEASFEYNNTPRIIPSPLPGPQLEAVRRTALAAWHVLECSDYARVDLRLDENGQPVILEVNANPDISPGGGFEAALKAANVPYEHFVSIVLENADHRSRRLPANPPLPLTSPPPHPGLLLRRTEPRDREPILALLAATNFFRPNEIEIAKEVLDNALARGETGHYQSFAADEKGQAVGWVCFGPTPCAQGTFDIYWLAVAPKSQRLKIGSALINHAESLIRERGGRVIVVETSGRPEYDATRRFYKKIGYHQAARVRNFYAEGDDKLIYTKILSA